MKMLKEQNEYVIKFAHKEIHNLWFIMNDYLQQHKASDTFYESAEKFKDEFDRIAKVTNKYDSK